MRLLISDKGELGVATGERCKEEGAHFGFFDNERNAPHCDVGVYVGRGRRFNDFISFCERHRIPMLQCSSDVDLRFRLARPALPVANVPNASEAVYQFTRQVKALAGELSKKAIPVTWKLSESHQRTKTSPPATALHIAELLGIPPEKFHSVRRRSDRHSKHMITAIVGGGDERYRLECEVWGLEPYARGILKIARGFVSNGVPRRDGIYTLDDFPW